MVMFACRGREFQRMVDSWKRPPDDKNGKQIFEEVFEIRVKRIYAQGRQTESDQLPIIRSKEKSCGLSPNRVAEILDEEDRELVAGC